MGQEIHYTLLTLSDGSVCLGDGATREVSLKLLKDVELDSYTFEVFNKEEFDAVKKHFKKEEE